MERIQRGDLHPSLERLTPLSQPASVGLPGSSGDQVQETGPGVAVGVSGQVDHPGQLLRAPAAGLDRLGRHVMPVGSARGAVTTLLSFRFPGPPAEPGVRFSPHRALHVRLAVQPVVAVGVQGGRNPVAAVAVPDDRDAGGAFESDPVGGKPPGPGQAEPAPQLWPSNPARSPTNRLGSSASLLARRSVRPVRRTSGPGRLGRGTASAACASGPGPVGPSPARRPAAPRPGRGRGPPPRTTGTPSAPPRTPP